MKKIILSMLSICVSLILIGTVVYAYFADKKSTGAVEFTLGKISYTLYGSLDNDFTMAGVNIIDVSIGVINNSSINSELRVKFTVTSEIFGTDNLEGMFGETFYTMGEDFVLEDGYYYYRNSDIFDVNTGLYSIEPTNQNIPIITSIILDGYKFSNNHANKSITILITFEAKQADFVSWEILGQQNYDFITGE